MKRPRWMPSHTPDSPEGRCCENCEHFNNTPRVLEETFTGINSLSSVHGCSRGDAGICRLHDLYLLPVHHCPEFQKKP